MVCSSLTSADGHRCHWFILDAIPEKLFHYGEDLDFFLTFIDDIFWGNKSIFWENDFESLMMFHSVLDLSV